MILSTIYLPTRPSGAKEGVLVAWRDTRTGERVLRTGSTWVGRSPVEACAPALVVSDAAPGLIRDAEELWPDADRQRCAVHRLRNILAKLPKDPALRDRVRAAYWRALAKAAPVADAEARLRGVVADLERPYPSAAACLADALPALTIPLGYPERLRRRLRSTNLLERSLEELRRRSKVIGRFRGKPAAPPSVGRCSISSSAGPKASASPTLIASSSPTCTPSCSAPPKSPNMTMPPSLTARFYSRVRLCRWTQPGGAPIVAGTVIRVEVEHLSRPTARAKKTLWLWWGGPLDTAPDLDVCWRAYVRRFDVEHTLRFAKTTLG